MPRVSGAHGHPAPATTRAPRTACRPRGQHPWWRTRRKWPTKTVRPVDGGIPVTPPGIVDPRNRQQPAQCRSAPIRPGTSTGLAGAGCANERPHVVARPKTENAYSGSSITVLEGLEAVRKRPGMYIGSTGERGLHHMVWEGVDHSVDEALAGHCDTVRVTLLADGGVRVEDNGRGIPVDMHPVEKRPTIEVIMTVLHAGGKFDGKSYGVSGGLHGVGVTVVNALSTRLEVNVWRDGTEWFQRYDVAKPGPLEKVGPTKKQGTAITFWADGDIFETTDYSFDTITRRLQEMAFLNAGLTIVLRDERPGQGKAETGLAEEISLAEAAPEPGAEDEAFEATEITYRYDGGLVDYVTYLNRRKS